MPTIFDASAEERKKKQDSVEAELKQLQAESQAKKQAMFVSQNVTENNATENTDEESVSLGDFAQNTFHNQEKDQMSEVREEGDMLENTKKSKNGKITGEKFKKLDRKPEEYSAFLREEGTNNGLFSSFMVQPNGVCFESQHEEELILLVLRQHWSVNINWLFFTLIFILAPFVLSPMIPLNLVFPGAFLFFLMIGWYLFVTAYVIESFLGWYFNIYIITDERIIDIDFYSLIYKSVSEAKIERIEDVTATTAGFFGAFFNYGNITVQTAAEKREFEFAKVPQPAKVTKFLNELMLEEEREKMEGRVM